MYARTRNERLASVSSARPACLMGAHLSSNEECVRVQVKHLFIKHDFCRKYVMSACLRAAGGARCALRGPSTSVKNCAWTRTCNEAKRSCKHERSTRERMRKTCFKSETFSADHALGVLVCARLEVHASLHIHQRTARGRQPASAHFCTCGSLTAMTKLRSSILSANQFIRRGTSPIIKIEASPP